MYKYTPTKVKYYSNDIHGDWYLVIWLGYENEKPTYQLASNFPEEFKEILPIAKQKGCEGAWTCLGGDSTITEDIFALSPEGKSNEQTTLPEILFQDKNKFCVLYAFLNVVQSSKTKAKKAKQILKTSICGLPELANKVAGIFCVSLTNIEDMDIAGLLQQKSGQFLLFKDVHCVSIDCSLGYIYDSGLTNVLPLSLQNLQRRGFSSFEFLRRITR